MLLPRLQPELNTNTLRVPIGTIRLTCCQQKEYVEKLVKQMEQLKQSIRCVNPLRCPEPIRTQMEVEVGRSQDDLHTADMALLANDAYKNDATCTPNGWERLLDVKCKDHDDQCRKCKGSLLRNTLLWNDADSGFYAVLYKNRNAGCCVLSFRGTVSPSLLPQEAEAKASAEGLKTDLRQEVGLSTDQYRRAMSLGRLVASHCAACGCKTLEFTGHSLGGGLADAASAATGGSIHAATFNAAGLHHNTARELGHDLSQVNADNYSVPFEAVTTAQQHPYASGVLLGTVLGPLDGDPTGIACSTLLDMTVAPRIHQAAGDQHPLPVVTNIPLIGHGMSYVCAGMAKQLQQDQTKIRSILDRCEKERTILSDA